MLTTYIVPVALPGLQSRALEAEVSFPATSLGCILGKRELATVAIPGTDEMDSLDIGGSAEGESELGGRHFVVGSIRC